MNLYINISYKIELQLSTNNTPVKNFNLSSILIQKTMAKIKLVPQIYLILPLDHTYYSYKNSKQYG
jgi:hypothetical protein